MRVGFSPPRRTRSPPYNEIGKLFIAQTLGFVVVSYAAAFTTTRCGPPGRNGCRETGQRLPPIFHRGRRRTPTEALTGFARRLWQGLQSVLEAAIARKVPRGSTIALLDYQVHGNTGDQLIMLGTERWAADMACGRWVVGMPTISVSRNFPPKRSSFVTEVEISAICTVTNGTGKRSSRRIPSIGLCSSPNHLFP